MGGFFRFLLGGALGAVLGIMFVKKQAVTKPGETAGARVSKPGAVPAAMSVGPSGAPAVAPAPVVAPASEPSPALAAAAVTAAAVTAPEAAPPAPPVEAAAPVAVAPPVASAPPTPVAAAPPEVAEPPEVPVAEAPSAMYAPEPVPRVEPLAPAAAVSAVAAMVAAVAPAPTVAPAAPAEESHPAAWAVAGAAAAGLVRAAAKEDDRDVSPAPAAAMAAAAVDAQPSAPPAPPQVDWAAPVAEEAPGPAAAPPAAQAPAPAATEPATEEPVFPDTGAPAGTSDSVVLVTPQVLEEPLPGSGWESSAVFAEDEVEFEELLPVVADDLLPYEGPQIGARESSAAEAWDAAGRPDTAPAAEAAALRREVESPPAPEETRPEYGAVPAEAAVDAALGEDLKSRIEETRRRIREELEKPFAAVDQESGADALGGPAPVAAGAPSAASAGAPAPVIGEPMRVIPGPANGGVGSATASAAAAATESENGSDYDAMRARIELTRSRLKAKAFDAMVAGESALLGRDPETAPALARSATFDSEIEKTVDSTLREEDQ